MKTLRIVSTLILLLFVLTQCGKTPGSGNFKKEGFTSLFNGKDFTGWKIPEGDNGHWKIIDGVIDYDALSEAKGGKDLLTEKNYKNFTLHIEWRFKEFSGLYSMPTILPNGDYARDTLGKPITFMLPDDDSGILLRDDHQVNMWSWPVGSGEIWGTRLNDTLPPAERAAAVPKFHADNPMGEWNAFDITLKGDRVTVYLNNLLVIENCLLSGLSEEGPMGLQHHGGMNKKTGKMMGASSLVQFRNIWIKEI